MTLEHLHEALRELDADQLVVSQHGGKGEGWVAQLYQKGAPVGREVGAWGRTVAEAVKKVLKEAGLGE